MPLKYSSFNLQHRCILYDSWSHLQLFLFTAQTGINVPIYVGSLFVAVIVRNISETFNFNIVDLKITNQIGDVALGIFLSLALMSIQLIEIYKLAIPLIIIVLVQVVVMILFAVLHLFRGLGKKIMMLQ